MRISLASDYARSSIDDRIPSLQQCDTYDLNKNFNHIIANFNIFKCSQRHCANHCLNYEYVTICLRKILISQENYFRLLKRDEK
jgi:hypothetical protein